VREMRIGKRAKWAVAAVVLLGFGVMRLPVEDAMEQEWKRLRIREPQLDLNVREQIGQTSYVAALGGFRSLIATLLTLRAHVHWENTEYEKLENTFEVIVGLQPRASGYWNDYAWQVGWNERSFYLGDENLTTAVRGHLARRAEGRAREILEDGIRNNPDDWILRVRLAELYRDKVRDFCAAAENFEAAAELGGPTYARRFAAYMLARCPGSEREAYRRLVDLYREGPQHHKPTLIRELQRLESELDIPAADRVNIGKTTP
jgi:hypothetical protein